MTSQPALDVANFDTTIDPADDFYRYANGGWLAANPVPPEYSRWAAFTEVQVRNEDLLHDLMEKTAAAGDGIPGASRAVAEMAGDYWASGMDETAIEAAGTAPLDWWLRRIEDCVVLSDFRDLAADLHASGLWPIMFVIEVVGLIIKPVALTIRLFANMTGGHMIVLSCMGLIMFFAAKGEAPMIGWSSAPLAVGFGVFILIIESFVACLQAYIFTMLSVLFVHTSIHPEH